MHSCLHSSFALGLESDNLIYKLATKKHRYQWISSSWSVLSSSSADSALNSLYHKCVNVFICAWPSFTSCVHIACNHLYYILTQLNDLSICLEKNEVYYVTRQAWYFGQTECNWGTKNSNYMISQYCWNISSKTLHTDVTEISATLICIIKYIFIQICAVGSKRRILRCNSVGRKRILTSNSRSRSFILQSVTGRQGVACRHIILLALSLKIPKK